MSRFGQALRCGRVLLMDGAMGTELQRAGIGQEECYELWNLTHPGKVAAIHQAYRVAGAEVLVSHTFQANPASLARFGLGDRLEDIHQAALAVVGSVAGAGGFVLGDIGPVDRQADAGIARMVGSLRAADGLLVETFSDAGLLGKVLAVAEDLGESGPVLVSFTFLRTAGGSLQTRVGLSPEACAGLARECAVAGLGVNCGRDIGMDEIIEIVRRYRQVTDLPLFARPNAGTPTRVGGRWAYPRTPEMMADRLPELLEAGVAMVGGCCGTTPEHIAAFRPIIDEWNRRLSR
jgi:5-methyltetrahydrofolate--homocysteine methyltransferase